ncbi:unnamed protein product [Lota lota]
MRGATVLGLLQLLLLVELSHTAAVNSTIGKSFFPYWRHCQTDSDLASVRVGAYVPQCNDDGTFTPQQCWGSTGYCWCVNIYTGEEIPGTRTPPGTLPTRCTSDGEYFGGDFCASGWKRHDTRCFIFIQQPASWIQAQSHCMFEGGSLVSVHSQKEDRFLQELTLEAMPRFPLTWIGANDCIQMGVWMWSDGSVFDYDNFPRRFTTQTNGTCVEMNYGVRRVWMKSSCDSLLPYICAKHI